MDSETQALSELGRDAALLFQAGDFSDCLITLMQLLQKKNIDPKVLHNVAITEASKDGFSDPKRLIQVLQDAKKLSEELSHESDERVEVAAVDNGNNPTPDMNGNDNVAHISSSSPVEFDTTVAMFNTAVACYHLHQYSKSFSHLDALYENIERIDEGTSLRICLLLLDVALLSHHASRSAGVISYMEKAFFSNSSNNLVDNGTSMQQQSSLVSKSTSLPSNSNISDAIHTDTTGSALENSLMRTLSEEALEEESLQLLSSLDISGQNMRRPCGIASSNDISKNLAEESLSAIDLRLKVHLFKVRFLLLTRNLKAAKREVKMAMNIARGKDYPMALYLKSQLEYARGNHRKAIKLLMASSNCTEKVITSLYYNNLGCIYLQLGKHHTSGVFFSKALNNSSLVRKEKPPELSTYSQDKSLPITFNSGLYSWACGQPFHAAHCFQKASLIFYDRPLLWLRIAECCLMALEKGLIKSSNSSSDRSDISVSINGMGKWRHLSLWCGVLPNRSLEHFKNDGLFQGNGKKLELSISLARRCLVNALLLLDSLEEKYSKSSLLYPEESELREILLSQNTNHKTAADTRASNVASGSNHVTSNGEVNEQKVGNNQSAALLQSSIPEYVNICMIENQRVRQTVLADLAYVELELGNPVKALSTAKSLLELPQCSKIHIFLGTIYAAEALCLLNQSKGASELLMKYVSGGNNVELPYNQEDCKMWTEKRVLDNGESNGGQTTCDLFSPVDNSQSSSVSRPEQARGVFCANYAANFALLGDFEQARHFVTKALSDIPNSSQAILTAIYVDLKCGKTQEALSKLKQHSAVRYLPGSSNIKPGISSS